MKFNYPTKLIFFLNLLIFLVSCTEKKEEILITADMYHDANDALSATMVYDVFSPPVASRVYAYSNIAAYQVISSLSDNYKGLEGQLNGLEQHEFANPKGVNPDIAALVAFYEIGSDLIFSESKFLAERDSLFNKWDKQDTETLKLSKEYGVSVANYIREWMKKDNYAQTRNMPKYTVQTEDESRWQPTPPSFMNGIEPNWMKIRPFVIDSASQFKPAPPPEFSMKPESEFHTQLMEVYNVREEIAANEESSEKMAIAKFWDCNPYVSITKGHVMYAQKKITPGGHWIGIVKVACQKDDADFNKSVYAYSKTAIAIADGFISCWDEKYRSNLVRPETLINKYIDENWKSVLQTPPFPEYTSGHSVVSGAAAIVLTSIFGDHFDFKDDTELQFGLPVREYNSFIEASQEAALSRLYGGIHYRAAIEVGLDQGQRLGSFVVNNLNMEYMSALTLK